VIVKVLTWVFAGAMLLIGMAYWVFRTPYGVELTQPDARAELNAMVVGLHLALGVAVAVLAMWRLYLAGLTIATLTLAGLAIVRTVEMIVGDAVTARQLIVLGPEVVGVVLGAALIIPRLSELRTLSRAS
jgi:hypothetical protein